MSYQIDLATAKKQMECLEIDMELTTDPVEYDALMHRYNEIKDSVQPDVNTVADAVQIEPETIQPQSTNNNSNSNSNLSKSNLMKNVMSSIGNKVSTAGTASKNFCLNRADNVLNGIHFVAITTANIAETAKAKLHHDEDAESVKNEMMKSTCDKQEYILAGARAVRKAFKTKREVVVTNVEPTEIVMLKVSDFQLSN